MTIEDIKMNERTKKVFVDCYSNFVEVTKKNFRKNKHIKDLYLIWLRIGHRYVPEDYIESVLVDNENNFLDSTLFHSYLLESFIAHIIRLLVVCSFSSINFDELQDNFIDFPSLKEKMPLGFDEILSEDIYSIVSSSFLTDESLKEINCDQTLELLDVIKTIEPKFLFRTLYQEMFNEKLRKMLGEFYTPVSLSEIMTSLALQEDKKINTIMDVSCGAGNLLIEYLLQSSNVEPHLIIGMDINPLAVLMCQYNLNYYIKTHELNATVKVLNCDSLICYIESLSAQNRKSKRKGKTKKLESFLHQENESTKSNEHVIEFQGIFSPIKIPKKIMDLGPEDVINNSNLVFQGVLEESQQTILEEIEKRHSVNDELIRHLFLDKILSLQLLTKKYDLVLGNPPYMRVQSINPYFKRKLIKKHFSTAVGHFDAYYCFFEMSIELMRKDSVLVFLTSNKYLNTTSGSVLRTYILKNTSLSSFTDFKDSRIFNALVLPIITVLTKPWREQNQVLYTSIEHSDTQPTEVIDSRDLISLLANRELRESFSFRLDQNVYLFQRYISEIPENHNESWSFLPYFLRILLTDIKKKSNTTLGELSQKIIVGIKTTANYAFIDDYDHEFISRPEIVEERRTIRRKYGRDLFYPLIRGKDIRDFEIDESQRFIFYPHYKEGGQIRVYPESDIPIMIEYLRKMQYHNNLSQREYIQKANRKWYEIWNQKDPEDFEIEFKIVVPDISPKNNFSIDLGKRYVDGSAYYIILNTDDITDALLILAQLNSYLLEFYHKHHTNNKIYAGRYRYWSSTLKNLPIIDPKTVDDELKRKIVGVIENHPVNEDRLNILIFDLFQVDNSQFIKNWIENNRV